MKQKLDIMPKLDKSSRLVNQLDMKIPRLKKGLPWSLTHQQQEQALLGQMKLVWVAPDKIINNYFGEKKIYSK